MRNPDLYGALGWICFCVGAVLRGVAFFCVAPWDSVAFYLAMLLLACGAFGIVIYFSAPWTAARRSPNPAGRPGPMTCRQAFDKAQAMWPGHTICVSARAVRTAETCALVIWKSHHPASAWNGPSFEAIFAQIEAEGGPGAETR